MAYELYTVVLSYICNHLQRFMAYMQLVQCQAPPIASRQHEWLPVEKPVVKTPGTRVLLSRGRISVVLPAS
ncbi:hypothetical protein HZ326_23593 [Fusarium oxysporum f. sp. albedinis]|nr:hypothetical protein HZ326_23593 [Fusarium oxysporum f. sp. albedinis]